MDPIKTNGSLSTHESPIYTNDYTLTMVSYKMTSVIKPAFIFQAFSFEVNLSRENF